MNTPHTALVKSLNDLFIQTALNAVPYLTRLANQFEADEQMADAGSPALLNAIDAIGFSLQDAGTMAANDLDGIEARRATDEHQAPSPYAPFVWVYAAVGPAASRLAQIAAGLDALKASVVLAPPAPPIATG